MNVIAEIFHLFIFLAKKFNSQLSAYNAEESLYFQSTKEWDTCHHIVRITFLLTQGPCKHPALEEEMPDSMCSRESTVLDSSLP